MSVLMAALRRDINESREDEWGVRIVTPDHLENVAHGCPACTLAAIRQYSAKCERLKRVPPYIEWDWNAARDALWSVANEREAEFCHHG